ncbi:MAG: hypothetical protein II877_01185, partial [Synergistaceae bacterium]|nr:hypothetical protein [Synergistaceae bacterium]
YITDDSSGRTAFVKPYVSKNGNVYHELMQDNFIGSTSFPLIRTECLAEIGGFDEEFEAAQDYDVWLRLAERFDVAYADAPLMIYHQHKNENIHGSMAKRLRAKKVFMEKYRSTIEKDKNLFWLNLLELAKLYSYNSRYMESIKTWLHAVSVYPFRIGGNLRALMSMILPTDLYARMRYNFLLSHPGLFERLRRIKIKIFGEVVKQ